MVFGQRQRLPLSWPLLRSAHVKMRHAAMLATSLSKARSPHGGGQRQKLQEPLNRPLPCGAITVTRPPHDEPCSHDGNPAEQGQGPTRWRPASEAAGTTWPSPPMWGHYHGQATFSDRGWLSEAVKSGRTALDAGRSHVGPLLRPASRAVRAALTASLSNPLPANVAWLQHEPHNALGTRLGSQVVLAASVAGSQAKGSLMNNDLELGTECVCDAGRHGSAMGQRMEGRSWCRWPLHRTWSPCGPARKSTCRCWLLHDCT